MSLSFLKEVEKEREKVSKLCAIVRKESFPQSTLSDIQNQVLHRICELMGVEKDCSEKIELLGSAIKYGKKLSNDACPVNGVESIIETFNNLKETWRSRRVRELQGETLWGEELLPILNPAEALRPLLSSLSFRALARKG